MTRIVNVSRRSMLKGAGGFGALVLGARIVGRPMINAAVAATSVGTGAFEPNVFVSLDIDGSVAIVCHRSEMGQGVRTGLPQIVADEMEADWSRVSVWQAPGDPSRYKYKDNQNTDGSRSIRHHFTIMREMGAQARDLLERAAARQWGVDRGEVYARDHRVHHTGSGRSLGFGELAQAAAELEPAGGDGAPRLKDPSEWKYIGRDLPIVDLYDMTTGGATYGADVRLPGMKIAVVARCPVYRGRAKTFDATEALEVPGVEQVIEIPPLGDRPAEFRPLGGVAVIGANTWSVMQGRGKLKIDWEPGPNESHDTDTYESQLIESARAGGHVIRERGEPDGAFAGAAKVHEADYYVPYFIHTPMEPPVAVVDATRTPVRIWAATQAPNETRQYVAEALGIDQANVACNVTLLGGAFGRKSKPDFAAEAAILSKRVGAPVRMQWTREDEIQQGYYHACCAQNLKAAVDDSGKVTAWRQSAAYPSLMTLWEPERNVGSSLENGLGLVDMPYNAVPNIRIENGEARAHLRIGWYRSVNNIQHAFAMNCFVNELAETTGRDHVELLLELIGQPTNLDLTADGVEDYFNYGDPIADWPIMTGRLSNVLRVAADKSGWGKSLPRGHGLGIACHRSFHSYVATAVHVAVQDDGNFSIPQVDVAVDCGRYVNPDRVRSQIEGATVYGNTVARHGRITTKQGAVEQSNFHDYPISRISDAPLDVRVHIVEDYTDHRPCGVGEPGVPPFAPALANALYQASGKRIRRLPIDTAELART